MLLSRRGVKPSLLLLAALVGPLMAAAANGSQPVRPPVSDDVESLRAEAYEAAQWAAISDAAAGLARVAARFALGEDRIAELERAKEQKLRLRAQLAGEEAADRREQLAREIEAVEREIALTEPAYAELTRPSVLSIPQTQALLKQDEALLLVATASDATYVFAVSKEAAAWARSEAYAPQALQEAVAQLRGQIVSELRNEQPAFDYELSHRLYQELVKPVEQVFAAKKTVMIAVSGPMSALPFHLLVSRWGDEGAETRFLIENYALTSLPAVSSLQALRCLLPPPERRHPNCAPVPGGARPARERAAGHDVAIFGAPLLRPPREPVTALTDAGRAQMPAADGAPLADPRELHKLGPLPGAQAEIRALRRIFGEPRVEVREAVQATEQAVKASRALASAQYVVFSTHGLVAGENEKLGIEEGGLVFTPPSPQRRNLIDDGYLTTSEAARLRLAAELVVLSACNTLSADVSGAAELSGLARAFFYAGARSVLASHWVVSDESTALMIADLFKRMEASPALSRAEAHRAAILELRKQDRWWSPGHWAAFVLVGTPD